MKYTGEGRQKKQESLKFLLFSLLIEILFSLRPFTCADTRPSRNDPGHGRREDGNTKRLSPNSPLLFLYAYIQPWLSPVVQWDVLRSNAKIIQPSKAEVHHSHILELLTIIKIHKMLWCTWCTSVMVLCFVPVILSCRMSQAGVSGGVVQLLQHTCGQPNEQGIKTPVQLSLVRLFSALQWLCALQLCSDWTRDGAFEDSQTVTSCVSNNQPAQSCFCNPNLTLVL